MKNWHKEGGIDALLLTPMSKKKKVKVCVNEGHLAKIPTRKVDFPKDISNGKLSRTLSAQGTPVGELEYPLWRGA